MAGSEPGDALRVSWCDHFLAGPGYSADTQVVNALLTQLDKLKTRKNVLVLTTSNLSHAIGKLSRPLGYLSEEISSWSPSDNAFIDRADIKEYVPLPSPEAIYWIFKTCFEELMKRKVIRDMTLPTWKRCLYEAGIEESARLKSEVLTQSNGVHAELERTKLEQKAFKKKEGDAAVGQGLYELAHRCHVSETGRVLPSTVKSSRSTSLFRVLSSVNPV
jgi:SpoVK/Ycf46/Vps4 family AAA+-type ATPase